MIARAASLAGEHEVSSALVGMAAEEGDSAFPDYIALLAKRTSCGGWHLPHDT